MRRLAITREKEKPMKQVLVAILLGILVAPSAFGQMGIYQGVPLQAGDVINFTKGPFTTAHVQTYGHTALYLGVDPQTGKPTFLDFSITKGDPARAFRGRILAEQEFLTYNAKSHPSFDVFRLRDTSTLDQHSLLQEAKRIAVTGTWPTTNLCSSAAAAVLSKASGRVIDVKTPNGFVGGPFQRHPQLTGKSISTQYALRDVERTAVLIAGTTQNSTQDDIDQAMQDLKGTLAQISALDETDRKLTRSNQVQIDTTKMLDRSENKIKHEVLPELKMKGEQWDIKRQNHIDSGCPAEGGRMPIEQANRCNPVTDVLNAEREELLQKFRDLKDQMETIDKTRRAVSETTLANAQQQKANNARRDELQARKKLQEGLLLTLRTKSHSCQTQLRKKGVTCEAIKLQCGMVQFDGADAGLPPSEKDAPCGN